MAGVTENDDWTESQNCGDRALGVYYTAHHFVTKPTYRFSTYKYSDDDQTECHPYNYAQIGLDFETFEG